MSRNFAERREQLARQIAGQRRELAEAYRDLGKPLHYTQVAVKGVQVLQKNAWLIGLAPTAVSLVFAFLGWQKPEKPKRGLFNFWKKKGPEPTEAEAAAELESKLPRRARPLLRQLLGHGVTAFKIYRRVRPYIPL